MKGLKGTGSLRDKIWAAAIIISLFVIWEAMSGTIISTIFLPTPSSVINYMLDSFLLAAVASSTYIVALGFTISIVLGLLIGFIIVYWPSLQKSLYPLLFSIKSVPATGLAIIAVIWTGTGDLSKMLVVVYTAFFSLVVNTVSGCTRVGPEYLELMDSIQASKWDTFKKLRFPNALPQIASGLKVAAPLTIIGVVVAELFAGNTGLGYAVKIAAANLNGPLTFAALFWMGILGSILYLLIIALERAFKPWYVRFGDR